MTASIRSRLAELQKEQSAVSATLSRIDQSIARLQDRAEREPGFAQDAEYLDRMTAEGGRRRIMEQRREEIKVKLPPCWTNRLTSVNHTRFPRDRP